MATNDHTVPQSYLRRFARRGKGKANQLVAARTDDVAASFVTSTRNVAAVNGFHWGVDPDGVEHHTMERFMSDIENAAASGFSAVMDTDYALPQRWPPRDLDRARLAWWIAAQILRTTRQRHRLDYLAHEPDPAADNERAGPPSAALRSFSANNHHLGFIATHVEPLAALLYSRPWGIGFSDSCVPTSDVPVMIMNGQDEPDQLRSVALFDVVLPLDPHRFLLMPVPGTQDDPATLTDHRLKLPSGMGAFLADLIRASADEWVFWHPDHAPPNWTDESRRGGRLPRPWAGAAPGDPGPSFILQYGALPPASTVERRWLTDHPD